MRDPKRIERVLAELRSAWYCYPDMRLGQLIESAAATAPKAHEAFYLEDDALVAGLRALCNRAAGTE